jgi:hypothetical protein
MFRSYFNVYRDYIFDKKKFIEFSMKAFVSAYQTRPYRREYFKPKLYFTETNWGVTSKLNKVMFRHGSGGGIPALKRAWCYNEAVVKMIVSVQQQAVKQTYSSPSVCPLIFVFKENDISMYEWFALHQYIYLVEN